jgi:hypothetical protein
LRRRGERAATSTTSADAVGGLLALEARLLDLLLDRADLAERVPLLVPVRLLLRATGCSLGWVPGTSVRSLLFRIKELV